MIPYSKQTIDSDDIKNVTNVLKSKYLTQGNKTILFEKKICEFTKSKFGVSTNSATSALHISCLALNLKKGDILWTVPNTFVASANVGALCGAKIDFVDIDKDSLNISTEKLILKLKKAKKFGRLPKILIPVDFAGNPYDQEIIFKLSRKYKFKIIEDASHALGSKYNNKIIGNGKWSDITVFSFHPVKPITSAEGGIAVTNNKMLSEKLKLLRNHGVIKDKKKLLNKNLHNWYYEQVSLGFNYRMNELEATLGLSQMKKLISFNKKRNTLAKRYISVFKKLSIKYQYIKKNNYSSYHLFVIIFPNTKKVIKNYDKIFREFYKNKIAVMLHYIPVHLQPFYKLKGFKKGDFPISENYASRSFSIPNFPGLKKSQQEKVISVITTIYRKYL
jgi:UDP-4-amino-4,6-dideoxy-N-acetyl-beta-L-altrosamine transaminase